jgi:hypothetical protein
LTPRGSKRALGRLARRRPWSWVVATAIAGGLPITSSPALAAIDQVGATAAVGGWGVGASPFEPVGPESGHHWGGCEAVTTAATGITTGTTTETATPSGSGSTTTTSKSNFRRSSRGERRTTPVRRPVRRVPWARTAPRAIPEPPEPFARRAELPRAPCPGAGRPGRANPGIRG